MEIDYIAKTFQKSQQTKKYQNCNNNNKKTGVNSNAVDARGHPIANSNNVNNNNFLNCAAPKSVLAQNCHMIRQLQRNYPPYPCDIGVYHPQPAPQQSPSSHVMPSASSSHHQSLHKSSPNHHQAYHNQSALAMASLPPSLPNNVNASHFKPLQLELHSNTSSPFKSQRHPSILKNYKSCPVSPVHEEMDWCSMDASNDGISSMGGRNGGNEKYYSKRHSMYSDDAKIILDKIHADTEQMIAEITMKYGNLDDPAARMVERAKMGDAPMPSAAAATTNTHTNNPFHPKNLLRLQQEEEAGNFSSDSLEDCSLDLSAGDKCNTRSTRKSVCRKKHRKYDTSQPQSSFPKRSVSDYYIYDDYNDTPNPNRNVSLAEILNDDEEKARKEYAFINSQRHSSASFFLAPERRSQESLLSDDMSGCGGVSYCNSMESILSDESDCKSAPLEVLFGRTKRDFYRYPGNQYDPNRVDTNCSSKSYGSSPNNGTSSFDYYMEHQQSMIAGGYCNDAYNASNYGCYDSFVSSARNGARAAPPPPPPQFQNKPYASYSKPIPTSSTFPSISEHLSPRNEEFIPRLGNQSLVYTTTVNRSLSKEFANQRQQNNSNPLYSCSSDEEYFERKPVSSSPTCDESPPVDIPSAPLLPVTAMRKSCSFEIEMFHSRGKALQQKSAAKKYEQNLQKFEKDRNRGRGQSQFGGTLEYVPHKPPVANRRTGSVKTKRGLREKDRYHTVSQIKCSESRSEKRTSKLDDNLASDNESREKSIELYLAETSSVDDDNMDSLELYSKPNLYKENSVDSLDDLGPSKTSAAKKAAVAAANNAIAGSATDAREQSIVTEDFLSQAEYLKFRDIEKKIDVINKLVEMEEKKLEQERVTKELRMRPFKADAQKKGYVKSLTMNFDNLAKTLQYECDLNQKQFPHSDIKRNYSLPDVLEVAKYQFLSHDEFDGSIRDKVEQFLEGKISMAATEPNGANEGALPQQSPCDRVIRNCTNYLRRQYDLCVIIF